MIMITEYMMTNITQAVQAANQVMMSVIMSVLSADVSSWYFENILQSRWNK
jgi:hypothetical protein